MRKTVIALSLFMILAVAWDSRAEDTPELQPPGMEEPSDFPGDPPGDASDNPPGDPTETPPVDAAPVEVGPAEAPAPKAPELEVIDWKSIRNIFQPVAVGKSDAPKQPPADQGKKPPAEKPPPKPKPKPATGIKRRLPALAGVMIGETGGSVAIINNKMVKKGDRVDGFTVQKISATEVVLSYDGEEVTLYVKK